MTAPAARPAAEQHEIDEFEDRVRATDHFVGRFPGGITFEGMHVLDFGCGYGAATIRAVRGGAIDAMGVDLDHTDVAAAIVRTLYPDLVGLVTFEDRSIVRDPLPAERFDLIISEATFEHVVGLPEHLAALRQTLKPGGRLYTGFSPLYNAPRGDHGRLRAPLRRIFPWAHLLWPRRWLLGRVGAASLADLGLSGLSLREYVEAFEASDMSIRHFEVNNQRVRAARLIEPFRAHTPLREFLSYSIYAILERPVS